MTITSHIAILVPSVDNAAAVLVKYGLTPGPKEKFDGEGTAEIYVGDSNSSAKLLLMQAIGKGAYKDALKKRGPGLHHVALDVKDLEAFIHGMSGTGWYLHPKSLGTIRKTRTAWLVRPGTKMMIEVQERDEIYEDPKFISYLELPLNPKERSMVKALGIDTLRPSKDRRSRIVFGKKKIEVADLIRSRKNK